MVGTLHFEMCRNVPKRCVVSGVLVSSLVLYIGFGQRVLRWYRRLPKLRGATLNFGEVPDPRLREPGSRLWERSKRGYINVYTR